MTPNLSTLIAQAVDRGIEVHFSLNPQIPALEMQFRSRFKRGDRIICGQSHFCDLNALRNNEQLLAHEFTHCLRAFEERRKRAKEESKL